MHEESRERIEVKLLGGRPWGFSIKGGKESKKSLVISKLEQGGKAEKNGLYVGDILFSVNGVPLSGIRSEAISLVRMSFNTLCLEVERLKPTTAPSHSLHYNDSFGFDHYFSSSKQGSPLKYKNTSLMHSPDHSQYKRKEQEMDSEPLVNNGNGKRQLQQKQEGGTITTHASSFFSDASKKLSFSKVCELPEQTAVDNSHEDTKLREESVNHCTSLITSQLVDERKCKANEGPIRNLRRGKSAKSSQRPSSWHAMKHSELENIAFSQSNCNTTSSILEGGETREPTTSPQTNAFSYHQYHQQVPQRKSRGWVESEDLKSTLRKTNIGSEDSLLSSCSLHSVRSSRLSTSSSKSSTNISSSRGSLDILDSFPSHGSNENISSVNKSAKGLERNFSSMANHQRNVDIKKIMFENLSLSEEDLGNDHLENDNLRSISNVELYVRKDHSGSSSRKMQTTLSVSSDNMNFSRQNSNNNSGNTSFSPKMTSPTEPVQAEMDRKAYCHSKTDYTTRHWHRRNRHNEYIPIWMSDCAEDIEPPSNMQYADVGVVQSVLHPTPELVASKHVDSTTQLSQFCTLESDISTLNYQSVQNTSCQPQESSDDIAAVPFEVQEFKSSENTSRCSSMENYHTTLFPCDKTEYTSLAYPVDIPISPNVAKPVTNDQKMYLTTADSKRLAKENDQQGAVDPGSPEELLPTEESSICSEKLSTSPNFSRFDTMSDRTKARASGRYGEIWRTPQLVHRSTVSFDKKADFALSPNTRNSSDQTKVSRIMPNKNILLSELESSADPSINIPPSHIHQSSWESKSRQPIYHSSNVRDTMISEVLPMMATLDSTRNTSPNEQKKIRLPSSSILKSLQNEHAARLPPEQKTPFHTIHMNASVPKKYVTLPARCSPSIGNPNLNEPDFNDAFMTQNDEYRNNIKGMSKKVLRVTSFTRKDLDISPSFQGFNQRNPVLKYSNLETRNEKKPDDRYRRYIHVRSRSQGDELGDGSIPINKPQSAISNENIPKSCIEYTEHRRNSRLCHKTAESLPVHNSSYDHVPEPTKSSPAQSSNMNRRVEVEVMPDNSMKVLPNVTSFTTTRSSRGMLQYQEAYKVETRSAVLQSIAGFYTRKTGRQPNKQALDVIVPQTSKSTTNSPPRRSPESKFHGNVKLPKEEVRENRSRMRNIPVRAKSTSSLLEQNENSLQLSIAFRANLESDIDSDKQKASESCSSSLENLTADAITSTAGSVNSPSLATSQLHKEELDDLSEGRELSQLHQVQCGPVSEVLKHSTLQSSPQNLNPPAAVSSMVQSDIQPPSRPRRQKSSQRNIHLPYPVKKTGDGKEDIGIIVDVAASSSSKVSISPEGPKATNGQYKNTGTYKISKGMRNIDPSIKLPVVYPEENELEIADTNTTQIGGVGTLSREKTLPTVPYRKKHKLIPNDPSSTFNMKNEITNINKNSPGSSSLYELHTSPTFCRIVKSPGRLQPQVIESLPLIPPSALPPTEDPHHIQDVEWCSQEIGDSTTIFSKASSEVGSTRSVSLDDLRTDSSSESYSKNSRNYILEKNTDDVKSSAGDAVEHFTPAFPTVNEKQIFYEKQKRTIDDLHTGNYVNFSYDVDPHQKTKVEETQQRRSSTLENMQRRILPSADTIEQGMGYRKQTCENEEVGQLQKTQRESIPTLISNLPATSSYYQTSVSKAKILHLVQEKVEGGEIASSEDEETEEDVNRKKCELIASIRGKMVELQNVKDLLRKETNENEELGNQVNLIAENVCTPREHEKYNTFVGEVDKIINLLLSLSGRLARVENALSTLPTDAEQEERNSLLVKKERLILQHEEAKLLKENVDKRQETVSEILSSYFTNEQFADYEHYVKMKTALIVEERELDDKMKLGEEQMQVLHDSLPDEWQEKLAKHVKNVLGDVLAIR